MSNSPPPKVDSTTPGPREYRSGTDGNVDVAGVPVRRVRTRWRISQIRVAPVSAAMAKDMALFVLMFIASLTLHPHHRYDLSDHHDKLPLHHGLGALDAAGGGCVCRGAN